MNATRTTSRRRLLARRVSAVGACAAAAATLGVGTASARPDVTTTVTHTTFRLVDDEHGILLFINKARADLCTPERLAFEAALLEWLEGGAVGDPPAEPASSRQGEVEIVRTERAVDGREFIVQEGDDVPVEVWRLDAEGGGIDCTATDGPGAELFASGPMDLSIRQNASEDVRTGGTTAAGVVVGVDGTRWNLSVSYRLTSAGEMFSVQGVTRLVELG